MHGDGSNRHHGDLQPEEVYNLAVDLEEQKPNGTYWDLNREERVRELDKYVDEIEPALLTGSPPYDSFVNYRTLTNIR